MADNTDAPSGKGRRFFNGPRAAGELVRGVSRVAVMRGSPGLGRLIMDWPAIVGPALAAVTEPKRFAAGSLTIGCSGPIAMELRYMAVELTTRINTYLGGDNIRILRFAPGPVSGITRQATPMTRSREPERVRIDGFPDGDLKDALERLGARVSRGR